MEANKERGEVLLNVGEQQFVLRMTFQSVFALESLGINLFMGTDLGSFTVILKMLHVLTGVSMDDADELMMQDYEACTEAVTEALTLFFQRFQAKENQAP